MEDDEGVEDVGGLVVCGEDCALAFFSRAFCGDIPRTDAGLRGEGVRVSKAPGGFFASTARRSPCSVCLVATAVPFPYVSSSSRALRAASALSHRQPPPRTSVDFSRLLPGLPGSLTTLVVPVKPCDSRLHRERGEKACEHA